MHTVLAFPVEREIDEDDSTSHSLPITYKSLRRALFRTVSNSALHVYCHTECRLFAHNWNNHPISVPVLRHATRATTLNLYELAWGRLFSKNDVLNSIP